MKLSRYLLACWPGFLLLFATIMLMLIWRFQ